jgi:hypothetical protein
MSRLSLSRAWDESKEIFVRDGGLLTAVALALLVLPEIVAGVVSPPTVVSQSAGGRILALVMAFVGVIGQLAIVRLAIGPSTTVGQAIAHGARRFPATLGALILLVLAMGIIIIPLLVVLLMTGVIAAPVAGQAPPPSFSTALLVILIAALFMAVKFLMTVPVASAEAAGPLTILKRSWKLTSGDYWPLFGVELLLLIAALALLLSAQFVGGGIAAALGQIEPFSVSALVLSAFMGVAQGVFTVLASVMLARIYLQLARGDAEVSVPSSGT